MRLISPEFLIKIESDKAWILRRLYEREEVISVVMQKEQISFEEACEFISIKCYGKPAPMATEAEKSLLRKAAQELVKNHLEKP